MAAKLIIYPPDQQGWRRVRYDGVAIGVAHRPADVRAFLAAAGMENAEDVDITDPDFVEWRGATSRRGNRFPDLPPRSARTRRAGDTAPRPGPGRVRNGLSGGAG